MGNSFATFALIAFTPLALIVFLKFRYPVAATSVFLAGMMFLPQHVGFDAPGLPPLEKESITILAILLGTILFAPQRLRSMRPGRGLDLLVVLLILSGTGTVLTNGDTLVYGERVEHGLTSHDILSMAVRDLLSKGVPYLLGRIAFRNHRDLRDLFTLIVAAGLIYSLFALVEIRLSPHFHKWIYGFHPNPFGRSYRLGGWRPMLFMPSGIAVGIFMATVALAATTLATTRRQVFSISARYLAPYLTIILVLCKSTASIVYGLVFAPLIAFASSRWQARTVLVLATVVLAYPTARALDVFPTDKLVSVFASISADRADSLKFRFVNEDKLVAKASERVRFGWGGFGRNRVYDELTGRDSSVTDGYWIILFGTRGLAGFTAVFGLLLIPPIMACRRLRTIRAPETRRLILGLSLIIVVRCIDLLPNGFYSSLPLLLSGALYGLIRSPAIIHGSPRRTHRKPEVPPGRTDAQELQRPASLAGTLLRG